MSTRYLVAKRVITEILGWCHRLLNPVPHKARFLLRELGFWSPVKNRYWAQIPLYCLFLHVICFYFFKRKVIAMGYGHFKGLIALAKRKKECNMIGTILVKDFCPLKIKIAQFPNGFYLNQFQINVEQIVNIMCMSQILWFLILFLALQVITVNSLLATLS